MTPASALIRRSISTGLVLLLCSLPYRTMANGQNVSQTRLDRYYPLAVGNTWSYRVRSNDTQKETTAKWKMTQVEKQSRGVSFTVWETPITDDEGMQLLLSESGLQDTTTGFYQVRFPPKEGDEWKYEVDSIRQNRKVTIAFKILSAGKSCQSGTFRFDDCLVVEEDNADIALRTTTYYAANVGPVKLIYLELNEKGSEKPSLQTLELASYKVQSRSKR